MFRIIDKTEDKDIIKMSNMPKNAVAKVIDNDDYNGHYVFKIYNKFYFDLTDGSYWSDGSETLVKLLPQGEKVTVEFFNEE